MKCSRKDCNNEATEGRKSCSRCRTRERKWENSKRPELREKGHKIYIAIKRLVMEKYGNSKCACCGESHLEFLSIDHVQGNGAIHRKTLPGNGKNFYYWLRDNGFPSGYRVLCMNCNFALGHNGFCPHNNGLTQTCRVGRPRKELPTESSAG